MMNARKVFPLGRPTLSREKHLGRKGSSDALFSWARSESGHFQPDECWNGHWYVMWGGNSPLRQQEGTNSCSRWHSQRCGVVGGDSDQAARSLFFRVQVS